MGRLELGEVGAEQVHNSSCFGSAAPIGVGILGLGCPSLWLRESRWCSREQSSKSFAKGAESSVNYSFESVLTCQECFKAAAKLMLSCPHLPFSNRIRSCLP